MRRTAVFGTLAAVGALVLGAEVAAAARSAGEVVFEVTSVDPAESLEFGAHILGGTLKRAVDVERARTPYVLRVPGREAYGVFRQAGGRSLLRVQVRPAPDRSAQAVAPVSLIVVRGDSAAATGFPRLP